MKLRLQFGWEILYDKERPREKGQLIAKACVLFLLGYKKYGPTFMKDSVPCM